MSPGNVAREGIPFELFRSTYPRRHVARETYPQRQVAWDTPDLSLGNMANVVRDSFSQLTTPATSKIAIEVPLSEVHEARNANVEHFEDGSKNVLEFETSTSIRYT
ncbi:hypothetical protein Tco_1230932 [Tanacetum coccineum]